MKRTNGISVLVVGPHADAHGGIGSVQWLLEQRTASAVDLRVICTHRDGTVPRRLTTMVVGTLRALVAIVVRPPTVVHLHLSQRLSAVRKGLLVAVARWRGVPTVVHVHGSGFLDWFDGLPPVARRLLRAALRPDRLVVLSEGLRGEYLRRLDVPDEGVLALPNPVAWPPSVPSRAEASEEEPLVAAFLGRFGARKGIHDVLAALAALEPRHRARLRLVAAGDGDVDAVRAEIASRGLESTVEVHGWIDRAERDALLARAALFVLPSSHEGLPMAVLEAMAWGVVPVVTPVGGIPEVVLDGVNGVLVPVHDPAALAVALARLIDDDAHRAALAARARADAAAFSVETWSGRLTALWAEAAR